MADLPTVDINGLEVFSAGDWNGDKYSEADLDAMVAAFDKVGFKPTVKAGHADGQEDEKQARKIFGAPALGYVNKLYRRGKKLVADITKVPRRFADLIKAGSYSRVSSEVYWSYSNHDGQKYPRVLKSVAFLGAEVPAITSLKEIEALYDENQQEFRVYEASAVEPAPVLNRYKEEGTFIIKKEADGFCVYNPQGEKVKSWPTLEAAKASLEGYDFKMEMGSSKDEEYCDEEDYAKKKKAKVKAGYTPPPMPGPITMHSDNQEHKLSDQEKTDEAEGRVASKLSDTTTVTKTKGGHMTEQEFDEKLRDQVEKMKADLAKEYERQMEYRAHKAREDAKAEAEKESANLREEIRKLQSEKRSERIEGWLKRMKAEGKIQPAEESKIRALREWLPDEAEGLKYFSLKNGKTEEHTGNPAELFESLFEARQSAFQNYSRNGSEDAMGDDNAELEDAGAEADRRAKLYMQKQSQDGAKVGYVQALGHVLKKDPELARRYNSMDRQ